MVTIAEALSVIHQQPVRRTTEFRVLDQAQDHYLAAPVTAPFDLPAFHNSAMDGYAVAGLHPSYTLVGEIAAGDTHHYTLADGQAIRIFTGGRVPSGTTTVIMQEKVHVQDSKVLPTEQPETSKNIRLQGSELQKGQQVFDAGQELTPAALGILASLGMESAQVFSKPKIRIIATGNELISPGEPKTDGQIYESNTCTLAAALRRYGFPCEATYLLPDNYPLILSEIAECLSHTDVLLLTGGISVGEYDFVKPALEENGVSELFYKVFQKPGKPLYFGRKNDCFVFALPGNPASSLTCLVMYALPLLQRLAGSQRTGLLQLSLPVVHAYNLRTDRPVFLKAKVDAGGVSILDGQGSSMIHSMAIGNALAYLPGNANLATGDAVTVFLL